MDWPIIGALTGVAVLAGTVGVGTYSVWQSEPAGVQRPAPPPSLLVEHNHVTASTEPSYAAVPRQSAHAGYALTNVPKLYAPRPSVNAPVRRAPRPGLADRREANARPWTGRDETPIPEARPEQGPVVASLPPAARPAPQPPHHQSHEQDPYDGKVLTSARISRLRAVLHLLPDQRAQWPAVEKALRKIGRSQIAAIRHGRKPDVDQSLVMDLYWAAQPLLGSLQPRQKDKVRALARSLGYGNLASML